LFKYIDGSGVKCRVSLAGAEFVSGKELTVGGTSGTAGLARLLVGVSVHVVVVHVFGGVLTVDEAVVNTASVGHVLPAGLALVGVEHVGTVVPSEPSPNALGQVPHLIMGLLVKPMSHGAVEIVSMGEDLFGEFVVQTGEHIIEGQSVG